MENQYANKLTAADFIEKGITIIDELIKYSDNFLISYNSIHKNELQHIMNKLDELKANIGIIISNEFIDDLAGILNFVKGYKINIGVWMTCEDNVEDYTYYNTLKTKTKQNFITGINPSFCITEESKLFDIDTTFIMYPGKEIRFYDITDNGIHRYEFNSDLKVAYDKYGFKPLPRTTDVYELLILA